MRKPHNADRSLDGWAQETSPFHPGEIAVQTRAGSAMGADRAGRRMIRDYMPDQHRAFFEGLPYLILGLQDNAGRVWASMVTGSPGFVTAPTSRQLAVGAFPLGIDPAVSAVVAGAPVGVLGIEFHTRRRNRLSGRVGDIDAGGFAIDVDQGFGNCPQYIQARLPLDHRSEPASMAWRAVGPELDAASCGIVRASDTLFIASASANAGDGNPIEGVDVSHRGGRPGFVRVEVDSGQTILTIPDFAGNRAFNTFGNIAVNPRAGLLFPDFAEGDILSLTGRAEIVWDDPDIALFDGAQRLLRFTVEDGRYLTGVLPWRWSGPAPAPQLNRTGTWQRT